MRNEGGAGITVIARLPEGKPWQSFFVIASPPKAGVAISNGIASLSLAMTEGSLLARIESVFLNSLLAMTIT